MNDGEATVGIRDRALSALGLAVRAGRATIGTRATLEAAAGGDLRLTVVATDATPNAMKRIRSVLETSPAVRLGGKAELGRAVGRGPTAVVGVTDRGLAAEIHALAGERPMQAT